MGFTCNIGEGGFLAARHVIVVEVHHDDSFFLLLQRERRDGHGDGPEQRTLLSLHKMTSSDKSNCGQSEMFSRSE